jgi:hypothetical protein
MFVVGPALLPFPEATIMPLAMTPVPRLAMTSAVLSVAMTWGDISIPSGTRVRVLPPASPAPAPIAFPVVPQRLLLQPGADRGRVAHDPIDNMPILRPEIHDPMPMITGPNAIDFPGTPPPPSLPRP